MRQEQTVSRWMVGGARRLQAVVQRGSGVGVLAVLLLLPLRAGALGTGDLDTSFGGDGKVTTGFTSGRDDAAAAVAIQPDGKIVVAGSAVNASGNADFALARYNTNGALDTSFSGDGMVTTGFSSGSNDIAYAVALQADGKIVVAGTSNENFALARYTTTGALDLSFSGDGKVTTNFGSGSYSFAYAVAIQPSDGKIVVAGYSRNASGNTDFALARYNPNGSLDTSFSGDGKVTTNFTSDNHAVAAAVAIQADGKIVVAGSADDFGGLPGFAVARYLSNGALDTTFSGDGKVWTIIDCGECGDPLAWGRAVALQSNGKIVVAGKFFFTGLEASGFALARYNANGTLDTSFSGDGMETTTLSRGLEARDSAATALALQLDGKLVVAGYDCGGLDDYCTFALARYTINGILDSTFHGDGLVNTSFGSSSDNFANALAIQPRDGRVVVAGLSFASDTSPADFALARYHAHTCNGVVVTQIGTNNSETITGTAGTDVIYAFGGTDVVDGLGGNDILCGGPGNDTLRGGSGNDILRGETGTDTCEGGTGSGDTATACETVTNVP